MSRKLLEWYYRRFHVAQLLVLLDQLEENLLIIFILTIMGC